MKVLKSKKGSVEVIALILILPFLLLPLFNTVNQFIKLYRYDILRQVTNQAILSMEINGGLTTDAEGQILNVLQDKNFDLTAIHIDYTPYPVAYGEDVRIKITYTYEDVSYEISVGGLRKNVEEKTMVFGPTSSVSKKYQ